MQAGSGVRGCVCVCDCVCVCVCMCVCVRARARVMRVRMCLAQPVRVLHMRSHASSRRVHQSAQGSRHDACALAAESVSIDA